MSSSRSVRRFAATHKQVRSAAAPNQAHSTSKRQPAGLAAPRSATVRHQTAKTPKPGNPRASLCTFTFADRRRCSSLRASDHHLCLYHARKEAQSRAAEKLSSEISYYFSGDFLTAGDLATSLGRLIPAVLRGDVKPKTARIVAYLAQTLAQTLHLTQREFADSFGSNAWRDAVRSNLRQNFQYRNPPEPAAAPPPASSAPPSSSTRSPKPAQAHSSGEPEEIEPRPEEGTRTEMEAETKAKIDAETETGLETDGDPQTEPGSGTGDAEPIINQPSTPLESALTTPLRNC